MRKISLLLALVASLTATQALADFTAKNAAGATISFKNSGDCTSVVCVVQTQPVDSTGAAFGVTANPFFVTIGSGKVVSGAIASGAIASGAVASGAVASGAFASGALASGSIASGAMVDLGSQADSVCGTATGTCSLIALQKYNNSTNPVLGAGSAIIGNIRIDQTTDGTTNAVHLVAGTAVAGKFGIDQTTPGTTNAIQAIAGTTGGASTTGNIAANNTTAVVIKASAGTLYGAQVYGIGSAPAYLKIYNATSATCGSGTPVKRLMIPAASTAANGAGSNIDFGSAGVAFGTGITYCVTTGIGDADTTAPAASTFLVNLDWK